MDIRLQTIEVIKQSPVYQQANEEQRRRMLINMGLSIGSTSVEKQIANEDYYMMNKDTINKEKKKEVSCPLCKTIVKKTNLGRHKKTEICKRVAELIRENDRLREENDRLKKIVFGDT